MPIEGTDYFVYVVDFPDCRAGGMVMPNDDGTFSVYLNARLTRDQNAASAAHERRHIAHGDFYRDAPVETLEAEAEEPGAGAL